MWTQMMNSHVVSIIMQDVFNDIDIKYKHLLWQYETKEESQLGCI